MNIRGITVSVNYSDLLSVGLDRWDAGLDDILVVTSTSDYRTIKLCTEEHVPCFQTDIFYANGAKFNKGAGLSEAILKTGWRTGADWLLVFDADIVPPENWRQIVESKSLTPGTLYGAWRYELPENTPLDQCNPAKGPKIHQSWVIGFFSLFQASDWHLPPIDQPLFETYWTHAGNFDTSFSWKWARPAEQRFLDLHMVHLGVQRQNWLGRGTGAELSRMLGQRQHFYDVDRERIVPPEIK